MQEYHQKQQKSPIDAQARIMGSLEPRKPRPPRLLYALLILPLIIVAPTGTAAIGSKAMSADAIPERQQGSRSESATQIPVNACTCSNASPRHTLYRLPKLNTGNSARWQRVLPQSIRSRIGAAPSKKNARCDTADRHACKSDPTLPQTMTPSAVRIDPQSVQLHTPFKS